jgi:hypothetical protein
VKQYGRSWSAILQGGNSQYSVTSQSLDTLQFRSLSSHPITTVRKSQRAVTQIFWVTAVMVTSLAATASPALGQTSDPQALPPAEHAASAGKARLAELQEWMRAYTEWKEWIEKWRGKPEPGWFGVRERKAKPDPPVWLFDYCRNSAVLEAPFDAGCRLLTDWQEDYATAVIKKQMLDDRVQRESPTKTKWWSHIHVDALWLTPQVPTSYGIIGIHVTFKVAGRLQLFGAPGAMLLNVPTSDGRREWKPATDLGFSYRLFDFKFPGSQRDATLHLNLAKAWIVGHGGPFFDTSVDLAGFSFSFN